MRLLQVWHRSLPRFVSPLGPFYPYQTQFPLLQIDDILKFVVFPLQTVHLLIEVLNLSILDVFLSFQVVYVQSELLFSPDVVPDLGFMLLYQFLKIRVLSTSLFWGTSFPIVKSTLPDLSGTSSNMLDHLVEHQVDILHRIDPNDLIAVTIHQ